MTITEFKMPLMELLEVSAFNNLSFRAHFFLAFSSNANTFVFLYKTK